MDSALKMSMCSLPKISPIDYQLQRRNSRFLIRKLGHRNDAVLSSCSSRTRAVTCAVGDLQKRNSLASRVSYDKPIPEEMIEEPVGLALTEKIVGENPRCSGCEAKGAILCKTCTGSGLYVDSILESQGIIVKVRCLGCGGTGNTMCSECGGRGHI